MGNESLRRYLLSRKLCCVGLLNLDTALLTADGAVVVRPFESIHYAVPKAQSVTGQITVGDIVQVEEIKHKVAHDAEAVRCAIVIAVCSESAGLQAAHSGYLLLGKLRGIGNYPFERVCFDSVAVVVVSGREWTGVDEVWKDDKGWFVDGWGGRESTDEAGGRVGR